MLVEALTSLLGRDKITVAAAALEQHSRGESYDLAVLPEVVVFPEDVEDVVGVVRLAAERRIPVTPVAVNSSLEGQTVPLRGGISLDLTRMNRVLDFRPDDLQVTVQPGVTYPQVNDHIRRRGLFFPIDPGAHASIGGMVSTNASGTMAVRYGVTADYVLALEVVTATGEVIQTGSRSTKSSSGYELTRLFCGAEGTLGVLTEVTLRLVGLPEVALAARVPFPSLSGATRFVTALIQAGVPVARCELVDESCIRMVNDYQGADFPEEPTVFLEFHGNQAGLAADAVLAEELAQEGGATAFEGSPRAEDRSRLWEARHNLFYAMLAAHPGKRNITTDVAVPISKLPEAVENAQSVCRRAGLPGYVVGHVGDGNFHVIIFYEDKESARVEEVSHLMVEHALMVGGTCTGEHGVGLRKLKYLEAEHGPSLALMRAIKRAFDPDGILNPGKKLPLGL